MSAPRIEVISELRCAVGESPLWHAASSSWYWVDIPAKTIWRLDAQGQLHSWLAPEMVACIAFDGAGRVLAGMETGLYRLTLGDSVHTEFLAAPAALGPGMRFNDGRCDRQGRFWSGSMWMNMGDARAVGKLYRWDGAILSAPVVDELITQNGLAWSPDGATMYLSDSHGARRLVWAFDYDIANGEPHNKRLFADLNDHVGRPDGAAVDADGCYWTCANDAGCLLRFRPDGKLDRRIDLPFAKPSMCSFGGSDMSTLLVTSIRAGAPSADTQAGAVVMLRPGVQGVAETLAL